MLVAFRVENFKSFKDVIEFSMEATKLKNIKESNTFDINNISLLTSSVIFGANASGKSSLLDAMSSMKKIINSSLNINHSKRYTPQPFLLSTETNKSATTFEIQFILKKVLYRYGFAINIDSTIEEEWLYQKKLIFKARENKLFERNKQIIILGRLFREGRLIIDKTRENSLFLSVVAQFNGEISKEIFEWVSDFNIISNINSESFEHYSFSKLGDDHFREKIVRLIKSADIGIYDILKKEVSFDDLKKDSPNFSKLPDIILNDLVNEKISTIETFHIRYKENNIFDKIKSFPLEFESDGTQKLLALSGPIIDTLERGGILIIDELDNSLHTELIESIIRLFNSKNQNMNNAQIIFTTHNTNLLNQELFRRDQIWFTQKSITGESELYSLIEYGKGKLKDNLSLENKYLEGEFGAIPHIGSSLDYEAT
jgi:AAA15 family ATPase/GTPase